ncbi:MAG: DNA helicase, partial [Bacteroidaceae bacterium]|nr:DNA helicase [Bacteroidaceae bacterium]
EIADFVNKYFYKEEALIPVPLEHQTETQPYPNIPENVEETWIDRHRMIFIDVKKSDEESNLKANTNEAKVAAWIVLEVKKRYADRFNARKTVGIIVPYRNQISTVRQELEKTGVPEFMDISVDTVERYQGSQRDVIIYSFTICHPSQLSFLSANTFYENGRTIDRKFNVAITRARRQFIALGNREIVGINDVFAAFLDHSNVKVVNLQPNGIHKN